MHVLLILATFGRRGAAPKGQTPAGNGLDNPQIPLYSRGSAHVPPTPEGTLLEGTLQEGILLEGTLLEGTFLEGILLEGTTLSIGIH